MSRHWIVLCTLLLGCAKEPSPSDQAAPVPTSSHSSATQNSVSTAAPMAETFVLEPGFALIPFSDLAVFPADETTQGTWTSSHEEFLCTGKPKCYLHTKNPLGDGTLRFDYRFEPDPKLTDPIKLAGQNNGVLLFIQEPHAIWPKSIEVQGKHSEMGQLRPNGGATAVEFTDHPEIRETARKPVGEWNSIEIVTKAGAITASINGQIVADGRPGELTSGLIGLQSEGHRVRYRRLRFSETAPESP